MAFATRLISIMTSLTQGQVRGMSATNRQLLDDQCQRVRQMIEMARVEECRAQNAPRSGVLGDLRSGVPRHE